MKVVLLQDIKKVGRKYDVTEVSDGYALNFLIPQEKAISATDSKISWAEEMKKQAISEKEVQADLLSKNMDTVSSAVVEISEKVNEKGHLFAGLHKEELAEALEKQTGLTIDPDFIELDKPIKEVGEHQITVKAADKNAEFKLIVSEKK